MIVPIRQWHRIFAPNATELSRSVFPAAIGASDAELLHLVHADERALWARWERLAVMCGPRLPSGVRRPERLPALDSGWGVAVATQGRLPEAWDVLLRGLSPAPAGSRRAQSPVQCGRSDPAGNDGEVGR